jgi:hypothetical protein
VPSETHTSVSHDVIDPDMLAKILFDDEVPEMISERLHCSAPVDHVPVDNVLDVVVPSVSDPTNVIKNCLYFN